MEEVLTTTKKIIDEFGAEPEALVEILRELSQTFGYLTSEHMEVVANKLNLPSSQVYSVASFYSMINLKPVGKHVIRFCEDAPCHVVGGREVWEALEQELGIPFGETTLDGTWTLMTTSCIGACAVGPVMMVDENIYGNLTPDKVQAIIAEYRAADAAAAQGGE
ncbi:MAG: NADH-quinone oxidoreductase subunit NuoE [Anaerolineae bacterium]|nr:NADH-quinone oxidoreductase subunit NuoE [Anaerolineae bacterium]